MFVAHEAILERCWHYNNCPIAQAFTCIVQEVVCITQEVAPIAQEVAHIAQEMTIS